MKMPGQYHIPSTFTNPRKLDVLLAMVLSGAVVFFAVRPELSVTGELFRIFIGSLTMLLSMTAALGEKTRNVFRLNIFLTIIFFFLFSLTFAIRILGAGEWYISEIFEVTLFDIVITGILGSFFYLAALRASVDLQKNKI